MPRAIAAAIATLGMEALAEGRVAVVTLAGGVGSRWTKGAGVVKALNPFCKLGGRHRNFIEDASGQEPARRPRSAATLLPHIFTTSYLTHEAIEQHLRAAKATTATRGRCCSRPGAAIGLRMVPMERDLRFAWEEMPQQMLDEQAQKVREGLHAALIGWAAQAGEGSDYTDNLPMQCLHPVGHWYEVPNLLRNGVLPRLLAERPHLKYLLVHNIDTAGADVDAGAAGPAHRERRGADHGGDRAPSGRSRRRPGAGGRRRAAGGRPGAAATRRLESRLSYYNSATYWIDIDRLLAVFGLTRDDLADDGTGERGRARAGGAHADLHHAQGREEALGQGPGRRLSGGAIREALGRHDRAARSATAASSSVPRLRGQQLKEPAQLDGWLRDGSAAYTDSLCAWE